MAKQKDVRKTVRIPLVGTFTTRRNAAVTTDQYFHGVMFDEVINTVTNSKHVFVEKAPTWQINSGTVIDYPGAGYTPIDMISLQSHTLPTLVHIWNKTAGGDASVQVYNSNLNDGELIDDIVWHLNEGFLAGVSFVTITDITSGAWFLPMDAITGLTFTGDTTSGTPTITNVSSLTGVYVGQGVSGTGIPASTRIQSIDSATQITLTANTTATNAGITITRTRVAKIIDTDFPTNTVGNFVFLNGRAYIMTADGKIYNSALNDLSSWAASEFISSQAFPDKGVGLMRYSNYIAAFGHDSIEFFQDVGNPTGSPLQSLSEKSIRAGTLSSKNICALGDSIYFAGYVSGGSPSVYVLNNFQLQRVSNRFVDNYVRENLTSVSANALTPTLGLVPLTLWGKTFLLLNNNNSVSYALDLNNNIWTRSIWQNVVASTNAFSSSGSVLTKEITYVIGAGTAGIGEFDVNDTTAYGTTGTIQTVALDFESSARKRFHKFVLVGDNESSTATFNVSWSDDGGATFSTARSVDMNSVKPMLTNLGSAHRRIFKIVGSNGAAWRLEAMDITYSEMGF